MSAWIILAGLSLFVLGGLVFGTAYRIGEQAGWERGRQDGRQERDAGPGAGGR